MIALLDGDLVAFRCAASAENDALDIAIYRTDQLVRQVLQETSADKYHIYISGKENFRKIINPLYKANRTQPSPKWLADCKEFLLVEWNASMKEGYEADDLLGINQTVESVICSLDKDLKMIPGNHYSWEISGTTATGAKWTKATESRFVTKEDGIRTFYEQMLIGDTTDNVEGIRGLGPKKSKTYLSSAETEQELFDLVYNKYNDPQRFLMNGICLWILQEEGVTWVHHLVKNNLILPEDLKQGVEVALESMKSFMETT